ncbi:hypothetical protein HAALTHF_29900n [Vreelandella aquamarina]|nr:hypothetical protein HAALTHF_29900n [Halomonas axialensis]
MTLERLANARGPVFVYDGNGCQWETMGHDLLDTDADFTAAIDRVDALFQRYGRFSLRDELAGRNRSEGEESRFVRTEIAQPALFALQVALTEWLKAQGITPAAVFGHSVGEVAAAWASGALSLEDAVKVIYYRSDYQGKTRGLGEMTAVAMSADEITPWLAKPEFDKISLAGINSPKGITLAGDRDQLGELEAALSAEGTFAKRLPLDYAFHSPAMDSIQEGVMEALADIQPQPSRIPYFSTVTGALAEGTTLDAHYWWLNIREPVLFDSAATALIEQGLQRLRRSRGAPDLTPLSQRIAAPARAQRLSLRHHRAPQARVRGLEPHAQPAATQRIKRQQPALLPRGGPARPAAPLLMAAHSPMGSRHQRRPRPAITLLPAPVAGLPISAARAHLGKPARRKRQPWLADHVVGEGAVFPGAGFVELALAAALQQKETPVLDIEELEIRAPLLLDGPNGRTMRLTLDPDDGRLAIHSREPATGSEWQLNAVARRMRESRGFLLNRRAPALPKRDADYTLDEHLHMAERIGLHYGPAFQAIQRGWIEGDSVIGKSNSPRRWLNS